MERNSNQEITMDAAEYLKSQKRAENLTFLVKASFQIEWTEIGAKDEDEAHRIAGFLFESGTEYVLIHGAA